MGIGADLSKQEQEKQSRLMRGKVKEICATLGINLQDTWTEYTDRGQSEKMITRMHLFILCTTQP
jgi:hypothetical protein